jgi:pimeloyl-ACP methyl ester carboxylesterase
MPSLFDSAQFNAALFFPRREVSVPPPSTTDLNVEVEPGVHTHLRLHAAHVPLRVLLFHGNGEVVADYDSLAANYARCGAALAISDYRGYGASGGSPTLRNALSDAHCVLAALQRVDSRPVVIMGRSLGGACAAELAGKACAGVVGIVWESSGSSLTQLVRRRGMRVSAFSTDELAVFDPLPKMTSCALPSLVLHGANDALIRFAEAEQTARTLRTSKLVAIAGRGHNDLSMSADCWTALQAFFSQLANR